MIKSNPGIHWQPVYQDNYFHYATKEESRKPGSKPYFFGEVPESWKKKADKL